MVPFKERSKSPRAFVKAIISPDVIDAKCMTVQEAEMVKIFLSHYLFTYAVGVTKPLMNFKNHIGPDAQLGRCVFNEQSDGERIVLFQIGNPELHVDLKYFDLAIKMGEKVGYYADVIEEKIAADYQPELIQQREYEDSQAVDRPTKQPNMDHKLYDVNIVDDTLFSVVLSDSKFLNFFLIGIV